MYESVRIRENHATSSAKETDDNNIIENRPKPAMPIAAQSSPRTNKDSPLSGREDDAAGLEEESSHVQIPITKSVYLYAGCAALNSCNLGYDMGVNADAPLILQHSMNLTDSQIELFVGTLDFFAMIGALLAHCLSDRYGRRGALLITAWGFIVGVFIMALSSSYTILMVGRAFVGLCVGFGLAIDPIYISEISPAAHRGELVTWSEIAINVGVLLGFASGLVFYGLPEDKAWRYMFGMGAVLPTVMICLVVFVMPESPRWLVQRGREVEAASVLRNVYPEGHDVDGVVSKIKDSIRMDAMAEGGSLGWGFLLSPTPAYRRMLMVGVGVAASQQLVGISAIGSFQVYILDDSGMESRLAQSMTLIVLQLFKLAVVVVVSKILDKRGRRPLLLTSFAGIFVALIILCLSFVGKGGHNSVAAIIGLATYFCSFSIGVGPVAWLIPSEVFSTTIRARAVSIATFTNRLLGSLLASTLLSAHHVLSWPGIFMVFATICSLFAVFIYMFLPETKGKALEEMVLYFAEVTGDRSILEIESAAAAATTTRGGTYLEVTGGAGVDSESIELSGGELT